MFLVADSHMILYLVMWISFIVMFVADTLASFMPLNGQTTVELSNKFDVLFKPAEYTSSIWLLMDLLLIIWLIALYKQVKNHEFNTKVGVGFIVYCILSIVWLLCWHFEFYNTFIIVMFLTLATLTFIYMQYSNDEQSFGKRIPFSFYLAWTLVATITNTLYIVLKYHDMSFGMSEATISFVFVLIVAALAIVVVKTSRDLFFLGVMTWALVGISIANDQALMSTGTGIVAGVMVLASLFIYVKVRA